ncbi:uncharacterized protein B0H64DRAFT_477598 [Chaetomium fimeti]|uniref:Uncharacterized protein n=1 Tax=Chaetomium fimeti TaxID=1854472 RepID=A0AAE0H9K7_9PEZI|nr:hypothetical protein B0H64DRAFT_477598 [Chaetomium fimeti]
MIIASLHRPAAVALSQGEAKATIVESTDTPQGPPPLSPPEFLFFKPKIPTDGLPTKLEVWPAMLDINLSARLSAQDEDQLLNNIWIGLLGVEALMVLGVALRAVVSSRLFTAIGGRKDSRGVIMGVASEYHDVDGYWARE